MPPNILFGKEHGQFSPTFKVNIRHKVQGNFTAIWIQNPWNVVILFIIS